MKNEKIIEWENLRIWENDKLGEWEIVRMVVRMRDCENERMKDCENERMGDCVNGSLGNLRMKRMVDWKIERKWECDLLRMRNSENAINEYISE